jgi:hypothetical protein
LSPPSSRTPSPRRAERQSPSSHVIAFIFFELLLLCFGCPCVRVVMCFRLVLLYLQAFFDLENGNQELKSDLKDLYINNAM